MIFSPERHTPADLFPVTDDIISIVSRHMEAGLDHGVWILVQLHVVGGEDDAALAGMLLLAGF